MSKKRPKRAPEDAANPTLIPREPREQFDRRFEAMQTPRSKAAAKALFRATPEELGRAAVKGAKREQTARSDEYLRVMAEVDSMRAEAALADDKGSQTTDVEGLYRAIAKKRRNGEEVTPEAAAELVASRLAELGIRAELIKASPHQIRFRLVRSQIEASIGPDVWAALPSLPTFVAGIPVRYEGEGMLTIDELVGHPVRTIRKVPIYAFMGGWGDGWYESGPGSLWRVREADDREPSLIHLWGGPEPVNPTATLGSRSSGMVHVSRLNSFEDLSPIIDRIEGAFGDQAKAWAWIAAPCEPLSGETPRSLLGDTAGHARIEAILGGQVGRTRNAKQLATVLATKKPRKKNPKLDPAQTEAIILSPEDQATFVEAILNPPPLAPAMERAMKRRAEWKKGQEAAESKETQALQKLLALGSEDVAEGRVEPVQDVIQHLRQKKRKRSK